MRVKTVVIAGLWKLHLFCNINVVLQFVGSGSSCKNRGVVLLLESCHGLTLRSSLFKLVLHVHFHLMASCAKLLATDYCWVYSSKYNRLSYKPSVSRYVRQKTFWKQRKTPLAASSSPSIQFTATVIHWHFSDNPSDP